jgi:hypothetical protein
MGASASEGIDLFKIANRSISGWVPSFRLAKDFERFGKTVRNWIFLAMTRLMLKRLGKQYAS